MLNFPNQQLGKVLNPTETAAFSKQGDCNTVIFGNGIKKPPFVESKRAVPKARFAKPALRYPALITLQIGLLRCVNGLSFADRC
jgi:hypothetical protein